MICKRVHFGVIAAFLQIGLLALFSLKTDSSLRQGPVVGSAPASQQSIDPQKHFARCPLFGLDISLFMNGLDPNLGSTLTKAHITKYLNILSQDADWFRFFGVSLGMDAAPQIAKQLGKKVALGIWLGQDQAANMLEIAKAIPIINAGYADLVIVGSEVLLRGDLTKPQLLAHIANVRAQISPNIPVTTADVYSVYLNNLDLISAVDVVFINIFPYWEGVSIDSAMTEVVCRYETVRALSRSKRVWISEAGWPSGGNTFVDAVPSPQNAAVFFLSFTSWARKNNIPFFVFSAIDEDYKSIYEGPVGAFWGIRSDDGKLKSGMKEVFDCKIMNGPWDSPPFPGGAGTPIINFTYVPPIGSFDDLKGNILHASPSANAMTVYLRVGGVWWGPKPTFNNPLTFINGAGAWKCDITTGGSDDQADRIVAFLLPLTFPPPAVSGFGGLPPVLYQKALASKEVAR